MIYMKSIRPIPNSVREFFYDGEVEFINGVIELSDTQEHIRWRNRLLGLGYVECTREDFEKARGITPFKEGSSPRKVAHSSKA